MAVVIDLDPLRHFGQLEEVRDLTHDLGLGAALRQPPVQRLDRIARRLLDEALAIAALRHRYFHLAARRLAEGFGDEIGLGQHAIDQDRPRRRHLFIELREEGGQDLLFRQTLGMGREEGAVRPVLPAADEESLDRHLPRLAGHGEDIGVLQPFGVDRLAALNEGRRAQPVAQHGRPLEIERFGRLGHLRLDLLLHGLVLAAEEVLGLADQLGIAGFVDAIDARGRAALDLVEQARPVTPRKEAVGARPQQEQLLQRVDRRVDRSGAGEWPIVIARRLARAAVLGDARKGMIGAQQDEGEALVVAQQHIVGGAKALDQLRLEQQRLCLRIGRDDRH